MDKVGTETPAAEPGTLTDEMKSQIDESIKSLSWYDEPEGGKEPQKPEEGAEPKKKDDTQEPEIEEPDTTESDPEKKKETSEDEEEETEEQQLERIAKEEGVTVEELKESIAKDKTVVEQYKNDPMQIAKALRHQTSAYGKLKDEVQELKEFKEFVHKKQQENIEEHIDAQLEEKREELFDKFLELNPKLKEKYEDEQISEDAVWEKAKAQVRMNVERKQREILAELDRQAQKKKDELLEAIPKEDKEFIPEIKEMLTKVEAHEVLHEAFNIENFLFYSRGKKFTPEHVKSITDAAYKRGKEEPKIKSAKSHSGGRKGGSGNGVGSVSALDRQRALSYYGSLSNLSDDEKVARYLKEGKKNDSW